LELSSGGRSDACPSRGDPAGGHAGAKGAVATQDDCRSCSPSRDGPGDRSSSSIASHPYGVAACLAGSICPQSGKKPATSRDGKQQGDEREEDEHPVDKTQ